MEINALLVMAAALTLAVAEAQQFSVVHKYAHLDGSPATSQGQAASPEYSATLREHDRRRLAVVNFPLRGDSNVYSIGLASPTMNMLAETHSSSFQKSNKGSLR